jgi:polysaccharide deacetylase 2 family uncharacterized protein YibQ
MRIKILFSIFVVTSLLLAILIGMRFNTLTAITDTIPRSLFSALVHKNQQNTKSNASSTTADGTLLSIYSQLEIKPESVKRVFSPDDSLVSINAEVPKGKPMEWIIWVFTSCLTKTGYTIDNCTFVSEERGCEMAFVSRKHSAPKLSIKIKRGKSYFSKTARIAIIIEDFQFNADKSTIDILSFEEPLTVSMRAGKKLTTSTAQIADEYKKEIMILQPMEPVPQSTNTPPEQVIMVHYTEDKIRSLLRESAQNIPVFKGFSNYFGNRVLEDSDVMNTICDEIKKQNKYLIVSTDSRKSVAGAAAQKAGLPFMEIDYSFSIRQSESGISDSLRHCAVLAQKKGSLLIKGQPVPQFINALKENRQLFLSNGIQFVYVSDLLTPSESQPKSSVSEIHNEISSGK